MEKTENVIEIFRDKNYELTSANEAQNITVTVRTQDSAQLLTKLTD